jgi:hypothetical protein
MFKFTVLSLGAILLSNGVASMQAQQAAAQDRSGDPITLKCRQRIVRYSRFDEAYSKRINWQSVSHSENPPATLKKQRSPQDTRWSVTVEPDRTKPGPWTTEIYFGSDANAEVWKLSLIDNTETNFNWLSEKLVFGSIWWGRIYATDVILDLDNHKLIYREMANYGDMVQPCD